MGTLIEAYHNFKKADKRWLKVKHKTSKKADKLLVRRMIAKIELDEILKEYESKFTKENLEAINGWRKKNGK